MTYAWIVAGAAVGAPLRYFVGSRFGTGQWGPFPLGTLAVNVSGCFFIGLLLGIAEERGPISRELRLLLVTGFLGGYTTFSAFGWETYSLLRADDMARAGVNIVASVFLGIAAVFLGASLARVA